MSPAWLQDACLLLPRNVTLDSFAPCQENACPVTVMVIPMNAQMALDSVCTARGTQQGSTVKNVWMVILEIPSGEHPTSASHAPVPCPTWPILQNPATGKMELLDAFVKKTMLALTVKDVLLVTMETPCSLEAPVKNVTAVEIQTPT